MATPTVDLTEFEELSPSKGRKCRVDVALPGLNEGDRVNVSAALDSQDYTAGTIERWFERRGLKVSANAITNHRKRRCTCANG